MSNREDDEKLARRLQREEVQWMRQDEEERNQHRSNVRRSQQEKEDDEDLAMRLQREEVEQMRLSERRSSLLRLQQQQQEEDMELAIRLAGGGGGIMSESCADLGAGGPAEEEPQRSSFHREETAEEIDLRLALQIQEQEAQAVAGGTTDNTATASSSNTTAATAAATSEGDRIRRMLSHDPRFAAFVEETGIDIDSGITRESVLDVFYAMYPSSTTTENNAAASDNDNNPYADMYIQENIARPVGAFCVTPEGRATRAGDDDGRPPDSGPSRPTPDLPSSVESGSPASFTVPRARLR